ncbi:MAG TPA: hypothetical protein VNO55_01670 [Polyangia bacterium]|nr:hypothetical protein [Polyangia bacterium]
MDLDYREEADNWGRVVSIALTRTVRGAVDMRYTLTRQGEGSYDFTINGRLERRGRFRPNDARGLPSSFAVRAMIKYELLPGRTPELAVEMFDPFLSAESPTVARYRLEVPGTRRVLFASGDKVSHQVFDEKGELVSSQAELTGGEILTSRCSTSIEPG